MLKKLFSCALTAVFFYYSSGICLALDVKVNRKANAATSTTTNTKTITSTPKTQRENYLDETCFKRTFRWPGETTGWEKIIYSSSSDDFKNFAKKHPKLNFKEQATLYLMSKLEGYDKEIEQKILSNDYFITFSTSSYENFSQMPFDRIFNRIDIHESSGGKKIQFHSYFDLYPKKDFSNDIEVFKKCRFYMATSRISPKFMKRMIEDTKNFTDEEALKLIEDNIDISILLD